MAKENAFAYASLFLQITQYFSLDSDNKRRVIWGTLTVERLAESLNWRNIQTYPREMDQALGVQYRREADRLLKLAAREERIAHGRGGDGFSKYAAYSLAAFYLKAESLCFEYPHVIDILNMESLGQKQILRDINSMLAAYGLKEVGCKLVA